MAEIYEAPSTPYVVGVNYHSISLTWANNETGLSVEIQRKPTGGVYGTITCTVPGAISYNDNYVSSNGLFYYRIRYKEGSDTSPWSTAASAYSYPASVTALATTWGGTTATLTWVNGNTYSTIYHAWRVTGGTWSADTGITGTAVTVNVTMATENTAYDFRVRGYNSTSTLSSSYTTISSQTSEIMPPTGMVLSSATNTSVKIDWACLSSVEDGFELWIDGVLDAAVIAANAETYTKTGLTTDVTYAFKVRAKLAAVYSDFCAEASVKVGVAPDADTVIGVVAVVSQTALTVAWTCAATNEDGFYVYRSLTDGSYVQIGTAAENATSYADTGLSSYTKYYYKVRAYNEYGLSALSGSANETTTADLDPPTDIIAEATSSTQIKLTWTSNAVDATVHCVERKSAGGSYGAATEVAAATSELTVGSLTAGTEYTFRIRAKLSTTYGGYSTPVTKTITALGTSALTRNETYIGIGNVVGVATDTPTNSMTCCWRS